MALGTRLVPAAISPSSAELELIAVAVAVAVAIRGGGRQSLPPQERRLIGAARFQKSELVRFRVCQ